MNLQKEFKTLTTQFDDSMFQIFKEVIDTAKDKAKNLNLDPISTFIFINEQLKLAYIELALETGIIIKKEEYNDAHNKLIISERLNEKIYNYIEPISQKARKEIKLKAEKILEVTSLDELQKEYNNLMILLSDKTILANDYVFQDIELKK